MSRPKDAQGRSRLGGKKGKAKLEQYAKWLERDQPGAAASLREGLDEMFTIDDLGLPPMLKRCLGTTNIIDNSHSAAHEKIHRVTNWQSGDMAVRWTASALVSSSKNFRKVMGYKDLWMLKANLQPNEQNLPIAEEVKVG